MNTRLLLSASALVMGVAGIAASFLPEELLRALDLETTTLLPVLVQLLGALWFGFAMVNWTARGSLIGGIYNRAVAIGNLTHFVIGAFALVKVATATQDSRLWVLTVVYAIFAVAFALLFFGSPVARPE